MKKLFFVLALAAAVMTGCQEKEGPVVEPVLELGFEGDLVLPAEGGQSSFAYVIKNPAEDGLLQVTSSESWLGEFTVASETTVSFPVEVNETGIVRNAEVRLVYTYGGGKEIVCTFNAIQNYVGGEPVTPGSDPQISVGPACSVGAEGGPVVISYSIVNPVEGGDLTAAYEPQEPWIGEFTLNEEDGTVTFTAAPNDTQEPRSVVVALTYVYPSGSDTEDNVVSAEVTVTQDAAEPGSSYDHEYNLTEFYGECYLFTSDYNYFTVISDRPITSDGDAEPGSVAFCINIIAPAPEDASHPLPPSGSYTFAGFAFSSNTFSCYFDDDSNTFVDGSMELSYEDGVFVMDMIMTDQYNETYHIRYSGDGVYTETVW